MGAGGRAQVRPSAVIVPERRSLTCANVHDQVTCPPVRSVRIEGFRGSTVVSGKRRGRGENL